MADPSLTLERLFRDAIVAALGPEQSAVDPLLRPSQFADYQVNAALGLAKVLKRPPRQVAEQILASLPLGGAIASAEIAGPGFINVVLSNEFLSGAVRDVAQRGNLGLEPTANPDVVVIDYSSPNVAKEMHVGHLRSTIIGDAIARVLEARGHRVIRQNHFGDWGTPFGMLIEHLLDGGAEAAEHSVSDLNAFYRAARAKFESDPEFAERSRQRVVLLQSGDPGTLQKWQQLVQASQAYFERIYALLGVGLRAEHNAGESIYNPRLAGVVAALTEQGLAVEDDGAVCVFPPGFKGRDDKPLPLIIRKKDGGYGYATTDLAAVRYRTRELGGTRLIYVLGSPQSQHLQMVFSAAALAGWLAPPARAEHVAFGSVLGADGKMFKTRDGEVVRLVDLLDDAVRRARRVVHEKNPELSEDEQAQIARIVGIGAVKYADLSSDRIKDYVFDYDRMLAFEGNTAPYLQYAHARCRSILRKAEVELPSASAAHIEAPEERALALALLSFPSVVAAVEDSLEPHRLCGYLFSLATAFSTFFQSCPVLKANSPAEREARLVLTDLTARTLSSGLGLLGIVAPDRM